MKKKMTYALLTVTIRVAVEHAPNINGESLMESLEIKKSTIDNGKVIACDIIDVSEVDNVTDIVEGN